MPEQHAFTNGLRWLGSVSPAVWVFLVGQLIATVVWAVRLDSRVTVMELASVQDMRRLEISTSADAKRLESSLKNLETTLGFVRDGQLTNNQRLDEETRNGRRIEERIDRIVQALDSMYSQLQEHLRNHK